MALRSLINNLLDTNLIEEIYLRITTIKRLKISKGSRSARAIIASVLAKKSKKPLLIILPTLEEASRWFSLIQLMGWKKTLFYPTSESSPFESINVSNEIIWGQLSVLSELIRHKDISSLAIITTEKSLQPHLPSINEVNNNSINIEIGANLDLSEFCKKLSLLGYHKTNTIEEEGQWSRRGDIIDIYAVNNELPIRLELFGDQIEKLKEFDPITQRSLDTINNLSITPVNYNFCLTDNEIDYHQTENPLKTNDIKKLYKASLLDYLDKDTFLVIDDEQQCKVHTDNWLKHVDLTLKEYLNNVNNELNQEELRSLYYDNDALYKILQSYIGINYNPITTSDKDNNYFELPTKSIASYPNHFSKLAELIRSYQKKKYSIWLYSAQPSRTSALLEEHECYVKFIQNNSDKFIKDIIGVKTPLALKVNSNVDIEGIDLVAWKVLVITDKEIFGQNLISTTGYIRKRKTASSKKINPNKLSSGDYVVHRNHGIGKFLKIEKFIVNNESRDYLLVQYLDGTLRVAADQLNSLGRYRSSYGTNPKINKLGGTSWLKAKEKASKSINKVAIDLIKLYAERSTTKGYAFPEDGPWQQELEDAFPYKATPDQLKAVIDIKNDMEKSIPMDRLICGDVGYGKTEVAIRALFKAITSGKQVALLSPTTILSQQHWRTLTDRFAPYPIKVSLLNRFKSSKEKKDIYSNLKEGKIDVIVGTHLLLSKKIIYKDLGLLVIDEEQRFGVNQKEKIKSLKKNVDVITLSATPIPRTLYMSMSGVREMSLITTPPPLRRSIKTHLTNKDPEVIRSAICHEISRGGQIFYVVPRINGIEEVALKIKEMVPNVKIILAHGRMDEGELENAMIAFNAGEADLMLCTTIIESGLDIPRVNTILIEDAHRFGLSQLYQLRGRVGRSGIQAHAWLFYPNHSEINTNAIKRLKAIQEFSELGSGYQLAMRDMEIRGIGNIIGVQQSGQMEAIGFDLYMEILQESIAEIKGQKIPIVEETTIDLPITAFIPSTWLKDNEQKLIAYKEASECQTNASLVELAASWTDRFGKLPASVEALLLIMKLKIIAKQTGFSRIKVVNKNLVLETLMIESAFKSLKKGLDSHLQGRMVFKKGSKTSEVMARGLNMYPIYKQVEFLIDWLTKMATQISDIENNISSNLLDKLSETT
ncbi:transcription-repair coupling factor [Prochlorococcus marinus]|uniref:transcription-repair coupling factor n=1 Tax=Prochlorococcus marinus TaxID=1219 RepID=UPI0022B345F3|nr:transcription-repair coupling factor [Prochlorococcus marinus]